MKATEVGISYIFSILMLRSLKRWIKMSISNVVEDDSVVAIDRLDEALGH